MRLGGGWLERVSCVQDTEKGLDKTQHTNWVGWCRACCYITSCQTPKLYPSIYDLEGFSCSIQSQLETHLAQPEDQRKGRKSQRERQREWMGHVGWGKEDSRKKEPLMVKTRTALSRPSSETRDRSCCLSNIASFQLTLSLRYHGSCKLRVTQGPDLLPELHLDLFHCLLTTDQGSSQG